MTFRSDYPSDWCADVKDFMEKFGQKIGEMDGDTEDLRYSLMHEELQETRHAMLSGDRIGVADGLADLIYVAIGTALAYGIDLRPVWNEVHASNMRKEGGFKRRDGKILKPVGWIGPDIERALTEGKLK